MIRVADTRAAFERCAEIAATVDPDNPVSVAQLEGADGGLLLHDGGGYAYVSRSSMPAATYAMVRLTAVRRSHRRRGLATALKRAELRWAADRGYRQLRTDMIEGNVAMRAVNARLGYRELPPVSGSAS